MSNVLRASVVITTRNRKGELHAAIKSALFQTAQVEVIVIDDASTDGTSDMVRREFPGVLLHRSEQCRGLIVQRNAGARYAMGEVIFSIDDDAVFSTPDVVQQTLTEFNDPRIGAVAIPYIEPHRGNCLMQRAPSTDRIWVTDTFIGTAHAVRRDIFFQVGGYRESLHHQGEERDFCMRLLQFGRVVRMGSSDAVIHYESPRRDFGRMDYFGRRNDILFVWHNVPWGSVPKHLIGTTWNGVRSAIAARRVGRMARGICAGYLGCLRRWSERSPVSDPVYHLSRRLKTSGPLTMDEVSQMLPRMNSRLIDRAINVGQQA